MITLSVGVRKPKRDKDFLRLIFVVREPPALRIFVRLSYEVLRIQIPTSYLRSVWQKTIQKTFLNSTSLMWLNRRVQENIWKTKRSGVRSPAQANLSLTVFNDIFVQWLEKRCQCLAPWLCVDATMTYFRSLAHTAAVSGSISSPGANVIKLFCP